MKQIIGWGILVTALLLCLTFLAILNGASLWGGLLFGVCFLAFVVLLLFAIGLIQGAIW